MSTTDYYEYDKRAFLSLLKQRGIHNDAVLNAMQTVPREFFIAEELAAHAYADSPLPIAEGQTISQPYIVALMTEAVLPEAHHIMLEIGTGSGYGAAVLSRLVKQVYTVERHASLASLAESRMKELGYDNVTVICDDGTRGWPEAAPFDGIIVTAGAPSPPKSLIAQLGTGGRLIVPAGESLKSQSLLRLTRQADAGVKTEHLCGVRFVPLIGEEGWQQKEERFEPAPGDKNE